MIFMTNNLFKTKYKMAKTNTFGEKFVFRQVKWLRYVKQEKNIVSYKTSLNENDVFLKLDLSRKKVLDNITCLWPATRSYQ